MIPAIRIGHITLETPDIERQIAYFTNVIGLVLVERTGGKAYLATRIGQLAVVLEAGTNARCTRISLEVSPGLTSAEIIKGLRAEGLSPQIASDTVPTSRETVTFVDNKGTPVDLFTGGGFVSPNQQSTGIGPIKLGHVAFAVESPQETASFFTRVLGFRVSDWIEDFFVFQRCNPDHHTLNFVKGERAALAHFAFELKDFAHLQTACDTLGFHRIRLARGPLRHGPGHNIAIYHETPDGLTLEMFVEMDRMLSEELGYFDPKPWHYDSPQRPKVWSRKDDGTIIWGLRPPR